MSDFISIWTRYMAGGFPRRRPKGRRRGNGYLTVTTRVEVLLTALGSTVVEDTVAVLVIVFLFPWMKKLSWKVTVAPAPTVPRAQVNVVPTGAGQPKLLEMYYPDLAGGSAWVTCTAWASDGP
jgi:hypothetical protein